MPRSAGRAAALAGVLALLLLSLGACNPDPNGGSGSRPSFGNQRAADLHFPVGKPVQGLRLPAATGGDGKLTYRFSGSSIPGLKLHPVTRTLSGTPTLATPTTSAWHTIISYTATDAGGDSATLRYEVTIFKPDQIYTEAFISRGWLSSGGIADYFKVTVNRAVTLVAATDSARSPRADTVVSILREGHYTVQDQDGADDSVAIISVAPGTAYVVVVQAPRGKIGSFDVAAWFLVPGDDTSFDITLEYRTSTQPTPAQRQLFKNAEEFWEGAITGDLPAAPVVSSDHWCDEGDEATAPDFGSTIDDLTIYVKLEDLGGPGGTLAQAGPCWVRRAPRGLPFTGSMTFDTWDLDKLERDGDLEATIIHEMAHVLGFGLLWERAALLGEPSLVCPNHPLPCKYRDRVKKPGQDTHFRGPHATAEFDTIGGSSYVPVENDIAVYFIGGLDVHWRETVFATEAMTPSLDSGVPNPVSRVTLASLQDLGYAVEYAAADATYTLPTSGGGGLRGQPRRTVGSERRRPARAVPGRNVRAA